MVKNLTSHIVNSMEAMRSNSIVARVNPFSEGMATFASITLLTNPPAGAIVVRSLDTVENHCFIVLRRSVPEADLKNLDMASGKFAVHDRFYVDAIESALPILALWGVSLNQMRHDFEVSDYPF